MRRIYFRELLNNNNLKMAKEFIKNLTQKGSAIKHQMERGLTNAQISKSLGIP